VVTPHGGWCDAADSVSPDTTEHYSVITPQLSQARSPSGQVHYMYRSSERVSRHLGSVSEDGTVKENGGDELEATLQTCHELRNELVLHMAREHRLHNDLTANKTALLEWTAKGGGLASRTSQGSTAMIQFDFLVRIAYAAHRRQQTVLTPSTAAAGGSDERAPAPPTTTVCETGFNWGTSSLAFLCASPHTRVRSFDLRTGYRTSRDQSDKPIIGTAASWLSAKFPRRFNLTLGNSVGDVPAMARRVRGGDIGPCDLVYVDGGHDMIVAYPDMRNFRCAVSKGALMMGDDCDYFGRMGKAGPHLAYKRLMDEGRLVHVAALNFTAPPPHEHSVMRQMCIGQYA
jgi:hypothetical protein